MKETLAILSIVMSCLGITIGLIVFVYVRYVAIRQMDEKLETIHEAQLSIPNNERVGIEPKKDVVIQQHPNQESTRSTVTDSTYFVSYFGMCFQNPNKQFGMGSSQKTSNHNGRDKKMLGFDEERGNDKPVLTIEIPKHEEDHQQRGIVPLNDTMQTPPTDGEHSSVDSTLSEPQQKEDDVFRNNPDLLIQKNKNQNQNRIQGGNVFSYNASISNQQKRDQIQGDAFHNDPNGVNQHRIDQMNAKNQDAFRNNPMLYKNEIIDQTHDSTSLDFSEDSNATSNKLVYSDDEESIPSAEQYEIGRGNTLAQIKRNSQLSYEQQAEAISYVKKSDYIMHDTEQPKYKVMQFTDNPPPSNSNNNPNIFIQEENMFDQRKIYQSENQSYFSSDDDISSANDISSAMGEFNYSNSTSPILLEFTSPTNYMINKIDATLVIPDLDRIDSSSSDSGGIPNDSGDWELSSSSEDRSEQEEATKVRTRDSTTTRRRKYQNATDNERGSTDLIASTKSAVPSATTSTTTSATTSTTSTTHSTNAQHQLQEPKIDLCSFCSREYNVEEGIKFSFDDRCPHLMCVDCCEEGKATQFDGDCPLCNFQKSSKQRKRVSMPPRAGERREAHGQVVTAVI